MASTEITSPAGRREQVSETSRKTSAIQQGKAQKRTSAPRKIWIDLDNSPHVPFFLPIIEALRGMGHEVLLTARNSYQVCELLELNHLSCRVVGTHWGKNRLLKVAGTCVRAGELLPIAFKEKPDLSVSHGSRAQLIASKLVGIPAVVMYDYEFTAKVGFFRPDWFFIPQYLPSPGDYQSRKRLLKYPGLKEDVYASRERNLSVKAALGLLPDDLTVIVRPPATEAHYHNPEAERLLDAALKLLTERPDVRVILLPRNERQAKALRPQWREAIAQRKIIIPEHVVDGMDLIWASDLVISGGGTMNREAAALGVPVYSIFRGRIGAVDRYLSETGRLVLLESPADVRTKIKIERNDPAARNSVGHQPVLQAIVEGIASIAENQCLQDPQ